MKQTFLDELISLNGKLQKSLLEEERIVLEAV